MPMERPNGPAHNPERKKTDNNPQIKKRFTLCLPYTGRYRQFTPPLNLLLSTGIPVQVPAVRISTGKRAGEYAEGAQA